MARARAREVDLRILGDMPSAASIDVILRSWAELFGCGQGDLVAGGPRVVSNRSFRAYGDGFALAYGDSCWIAVPEPWLGRFAAAVRGSTHGEILTRAFVDRASGGRVDGFYGPAAVLCADALDHRAHDARGARRLGPQDADAYGRFVAAIDPEEWQEAGAPTLSQEPLLSCFAGNEIAAVAAWQPWGQRLADVDVATHPAWRRQGYARSVVSALTALGIESGRIMQYRVQATNVASRRVADALGYRPLARQMAFGLHRA